MLFTTVLLFSTLMPRQHIVIPIAEMAVNETRWCKASIVLVDIDRETFLNSEGYTWAERDDILGIEIKVTRTGRNAFEISVPEKRYWHRTQDLRRLSPACVPVTKITTYKP